MLRTLGATNNSNFTIDLNTNHHMKDWKSPLNTQFKRMQIENILNSLDGSPWKKRKEKNKQNKTHKTWSLRL